MLCAHIKNCPLVAAIVMAKELNENTVNDFLLGKTDEHEGTLDVSNSADGQNDPKSMVQVMLEKQALMVQSHKANP